MLYQYNNIHNINCTNVRSGMTINAYEFIQVEYMCIILI